MICDELDLCPERERQGSNACERRKTCICFSDNRSNPSCTERKKTYLLKNPGGKYLCICYHIDEGVIQVDKHVPPSTSKCDYLFVVFDSDNPTAIFIELKGNKTEDAILQISSTLDHFPDLVRKCGRVFGRIVSTRGIPNMQNDPRFIKLNKKLRRLNGNLDTCEHYYCDEFLN